VHLGAERASVSQKLRRKYIANPDCFLTPKIIKVLSSRAAEEEVGAYSQNAASLTA